MVRRWNYIDKPNKHKLDRHDLTNTSEVLNGPFIKDKLVKFKGRVDANLTLREQSWCEDGDMDLELKHLQSGKPQ